MKVASTLLLLASSASSATIDALYTPAKRDDASSSLRVVHHPIQRKPRNHDMIHEDSFSRLRRRQGTVSELLDNEETLYFANATVGTPPQSFQLHLDTGSSDLWLNTATSSFCKDQDNDCSESGTYAPNKSSTYRYVNSEFNISYADGSGSTGDYATDTVSFSNVTIQNQQIGVGYTSSSAQSILGIGYTTNEAILQYSRETYPNVPARMVQQGLINTPAYSLWLDDLEADTGSILFGGVDSGRYTGDLQTVPIIKEYGIYAEFIIALTGVGYNGNSGSIASNLRSAALLDSGSSLTYLPNDVTADIYDILGAEYEARIGAAIIDCDMANNDSTIDFTFSSPTIRVSMSELVIVAGRRGHKDICILGIIPAQGSTPVLGDTFLRSAYVVYDLNKNQISLAQTDFDSTATNIQEITSDGVPSATVVSNAVTSVAQQTAGGRLGGIPSVGGSAASSVRVPALSVVVVGACLAAGAGLFALI